LSFARGGRAAGGGRREIKASGHGSPRVGSSVAKLSSFDSGIDLLPTVPLPEKDATGKSIMSSSVALSVRAIVVAGC